MRALFDFNVLNIDTILDSEKEQLHRFMDSNRIYIDTNNEEEEKKEKSDRFKAALAEYKRQQSKKAQSFISKSGTAGFPFHFPTFSISYQYQATRGKTITYQ